MNNDVGVIAGIGLDQKRRKSHWPARLDLMQSASGLFLRTDEDYFELIGDDDGVFGCMSLLGCHDVCPKNLPLATQIAFLRRKMVAIGWK
jgi:succinate dehydrogenase/fumarate reductase-like Fe-S protein